MANLTILIVDHDPSFSEVTATALREEGHRVFVAKDGTTAKALAPELRPDVVLLEVRLRDGDGYDVARALRRVLSVHTAIIVVTSWRDANLAEDIDLVLSKPVPSDLFGGLIQYIARRRQHIVGMDRQR